LSGTRVVDDKAASLRVVQKRAIIAEAAARRLKGFYGSGS
jgi:hypothetical protein